MEVAMSSKKVIGLSIAGLLVIGLVATIGGLQGQTPQTNTRFGVGQVAYVDSFVLTVDSENRSAPFPVPQGFTGHLYVHCGGNQQAIFAVGSDGNGQFNASGGFSVVAQKSLGMGNARLAAVTTGPQNRTWQITDLPSGQRRVTVALFGGTL